MGADHKIWSRLLDGDRCGERARLIKDLGYDVGKIRIDPNLLAGGRFDNKARSLRATTYWRGQVIRHATTCSAKVFIAGSDEGVLFWLTCSECHDSTRDSIT